MPLSKARNQVKWGGSNVVVVAAGTSYTSDIVNISDNVVMGGLQVKLQPSGPGVAGDHAIIKVLYSHGDPDADPDATDEFDTSSAALVSRAVDISSGVEQLVSVPIDVSGKAFKVYVENNASSISMTVSAQSSEQTLT